MTTLHNTRWKPVIPCSITLKMNDLLTRFHCFTYEAAYPTQTSWCKHPWLLFFLNGYIFIIVITFTKCSLLKSSAKGEGQKHGNDVKAAVKWLLETKSIAVCYCWEISCTTESYWAKLLWLHLQSGKHSVWGPDLVSFRFFSALLFHQMKCAASTDLYKPLPNPTILWYEWD